MGYIITNTSYLDKVIQDTMDNALKQSAIIKHADANTIHLLPEIHTKYNEGNYLTKDEVKPFVTMLSSLDYSGLSCSIERGVLLYIPNLLGKPYAAYKAHFQKERTHKPDLFSFRMYFVHVPTYPNRLVCYNEVFNLFISDMANRFGIVLDPNHQYGIKLLELQTGEPITKEKYQAFIEFQAHSRIVRCAIQSGSNRLTSRIGKSGNMFELFNEGSGKKICTYVFHIKENVPYISLG